MGTTYPLCLISTHLLPVSTACRQLGQISEYLLALVQRPPEGWDRRDPKNLKFVSFCRCAWWWLD